MASNINIPVITDLISAGNPRLKVHTDPINNTSSHYDELNARIDELETAIGQDTQTTIGRSFAIRAEKNLHSSNQLRSSTVKPEKETSL